jgi:molybdate transport repressor ModE-like protein
MARTSLASLELLVAIDATGSISAAARSLGHSQPTVSAGVRRLERTLGLRLVERSPRGSVLTEDGAAAAAWARDVLTASDAFEASVTALRGEAGTAHLVVAASLTVAEHLVPGWLGAWRRRREQSGAPRTAASVELLVRNSAGVMRAVLDGDAELGFVEGSEVLPGLRARTVARDELVVVVDPAHPWARRRRPVTAADLASGPLVLREKGSGSRDTLERALALAGANLPADLPQLGSTAAIKAALHEGDAVGVVSDLAVVAEVAHGMLVRLPTEGLELGRRLRLVTRTHGELSPAARDLVAMVDQVSR